MEELDRHPDDHVLLDLIEGELDDAHARRIEAHLDACRTCGDLVLAARAGKPADSAPVEAMPAASVTRMDAALASAWRERTATVAAVEAAEDAAAPGHVVGSHVEVAPLEPRPVDAPIRTRSRGWSRRAVPILAFIVLAALAGTSLQIGRGSGDSPRTAGSATTQQRDGERSASGDEASGDAPASGTGSADSAGGPARGSQAAAPAAAPGASAATGAQAGEAATDAEPASVPPVGSGPQVDQAESCIATRDETALILPDGRSPQRVVVGPLGLYVVCG